ncbi:TetR/AcrR family transcriptional regulator [Streptomyces yaizuensis]|uniref:TetR family transcriptional regulator n=1 Tax=Streptomyces yaizuensis TaxID=2989713 RepID=A0ABQ5NVE0_9ACTN|nr:TetR family transcriptional regulator [Streptomyces sp. YSPA8]GLF94334.1 TetR family transcriptional regulator [Streptomyces sp. YSPA8]
MSAPARTPSDVPPGVQPAASWAPPGLRERKKLRTRLAIRRAAYRLITEQGYEATTVEQIADAAQVSPSTVFRYFPAKEDIVVSGAYGSALLTALRARPLDEEPLDSVRHALADGLTAAIGQGREEAVQRTRLMVEVPALRARMTEALAATTAEALACTLAERAGRPPDDLGVRVFTAAVLGALREVMVHWAAGGHREDPVALMDRTLRRLRGGLRI